MSEARYAELEALNGLHQWDYAQEVIDFYLDPQCPFALRPNLILELQEIATRGILLEPGKWRKGSVSIHERKHVPPGSHLVPSLIQEMCDYVNNNWHEKTAFFLSSFVMWRLNWIHPFPDGNVRTSRILSYIILCLKLGYKLPGSKTIPLQIQENREPYFDALQAADEASSETIFDLTAMESMLKSMLAAQLINVIEQAAGEPLL